jgi:hypothetical protein
MWDDRCTMHRGRKWDPKHVRDMHRTTVSDERSTLEQRGPVAVRQSALAS